MKENLGNPALVKVAGKAAKQLAIQKSTEKVLAIKDRTSQVHHSENGKKFRQAAGTVAVVGGVSFASVKTFQIVRRNKLLKRAASDPEVRAAVDIWASIPEGFKNRWKLTDILIPVSGINKAYQEIETLWKKTNTDRMMSIARNIHDGKLRIEKVAGFFKAIYRIDMVTLLNRVMANEQIDMFYSLISGGSGSASPKVQQGLFAVAVEDVNLRDEPQISKWYSSSNIRTSCKAGYVAGQVTGKEKAFNRGKKSAVFIELLAFDSSVNKKQYSVPAWGWKGAFEFMTKQEILNKYGKIRVHDSKMSFMDKYKRWSIL